MLILSMERLFLSNYVHAALISYAFLFYQYVQLMAIISGLGILVNVGMLSILVYFAVFYLLK